MLDYTTMLRHPLGGSEFGAMALTVIKTESVAVMALITGDGSSIPAPTMSATKLS